MQFSGDMGQMATGSSAGGLWPLGLMDRVTDISAQLDYNITKLSVLRVQPEPIRVSDSSVSAKIFDYEAFVLMGKIGWCFTVENLGRMKNGLVSIFSQLHASNAEKPYHSYHITTKDS